MSDAVDTLNSLIKATRHSEEGYALAAERVKNAGLRDLFQRLHQQRAGFVSELQHEVRHDGGQAEEKKAVTGSFLTDWMTFVNLLDGAKPLALLEEIERFERKTASHYESALKADLLPDVRAVVMRQYELILASRDLIKTARV